MSTIVWEFIYSIRNGFGVVHKRAPHTHAFIIKLTKSEPVKP